MYIGGILRISINFYIHSEININPLFPLSIPLLDNFINMNDIIRVKTDENLLFIWSKHPSTNDHHYISCVISSGWYFVWSLNLKHLHILLNLSHTVLLQQQKVALRYLTMGYLFHIKSWVLNNIWIFSTN